MQSNGWAQFEIQNLDFASRFQGLGAGPCELGKIALRRNGTLIELHWGQGTLTSAEQLDGPWTTVDGATNYHTLNADEPMKFFRVK